MSDGRNPNGTFAPGNPGNPNGPGRPKSVRRIEGLLRKLGEEVVPDANGLPITRLQRLMDKVYDLAEEGQQWAVTFIAERTEGKIREAAPVIESDLVPTEGLVFTEEKQEANAG